MSSDMMIVCKEDESYYAGIHPELAIFIDECGMKEPFTEFWKWFQNLYCGMPSIIEQMHGYKETDWLELTKVDVVGIEEAMVTYASHEKMNAENILNYLRGHVGKFISTENW